MKYQIITANEPYVLEREVNKHCSNGWEPHGSLVAVSVRHFQGVTILYSQAMVKK